MKKLLYAYLTLIVLVKAASSSYLFLAGTSGFPAIIFGVSLVLAVSGAIVVVRHFMGKEKPNELGLYFAAFAIGTLFNLIFVNQEVLSDVGLLEMAVTGNVLDILIAAVVILVCLRQRHADQSVKESFVPQPEEAVSKAR